MTVPPSSSKTAATCPPAGLATHTCSPGVSSCSSAKADRSHHRNGGTMLVMAVRPFPPLGTTWSCCLRRALAHLLARHGRGEGCRCPPSCLGPSGGYWPAPCRREDSGTPHPGR